MKRRDPVGWALLLIATLAFACGPSSRQTAINTTLSTLNAANNTFVQFDKVHQKAIVDAAPSKAAGEQKLADYRATQLKIVEAFATAYRAVAVAQQLNDDQSIQSMAQAALIVAQELQTLGVIP